jgi:hypothetical protein
MKSKYVIIQRHGMEVPLVFSEFLMHEEVAGKNTVQSAGFCELDATGKWVASGHSVSLKLSARPRDAEILNSHLPMDRSIPATYRPNQKTAEPRRGKSHPPNGTLLSCP